MTYRDRLPEWAQDMPRGVLLGALDIAPSPSVVETPPWYPPHLLIDPWLNLGAWAAAVDNYAKEQR